VNSAVIIAGIAISSPILLLVAHWAAWALIPRLILIPAGGSHTILRQTRQHPRLLPVDL